MRLTIFVLLLTLGSFEPVSGQSPKSPTSIDEYFDTSASVLIVEVRRVGPVNILLRANVEAEVLMIVKGPKVPKTVSILSQYGMEEGKRYLVRSRYGNEVGEGLFAETRDSVIPLTGVTSIEELKSLSPRIVVLRTMNLRILELEGQIRRSEYELKTLQNARRDH